MAGEADQAAGGGFLDEGFFVAFGRQAARRGWVGDEPGLDIIGASLRDAESIAYLLDSASAFAS